MAADETDIVIEYRAIVERRVREQITRHQNVNPNADPRKAVEIQMRQEREHLERLIERDETSSAEVKVFRLLIEWLPELERKIKGR